MTKCRSLVPILASLLLMTALQPAETTAQVQEPQIRPADQPRSPLDEDFRNGIAFDIITNNFGFGLGGEYRRLLTPKIDLTFTARITGLRDVSEQTFTDFFFGQQIIPNKYQRALAFPITAGIRHRIFSNAIDDNYRIYVGGSVGPVFAFSYPYFEDRFNNGFRENFPEINRVDPINDIFSGMDDGEWHLGFGGEFSISLDFGDNFANLNTVRFGYLFYYFDDGIQLMQPRQPIGIRETDDGFFEFVTEPFFEAQKFFGTPQISFVFGTMW